MPRSPRTLQDRTAVAILEAAARVLARRGEAATISDVAVEAGVGRATLYRYYKTRDQLVSALWEAALAEIDERLEAARLDQVPFEEGLARVVRAIASIGEHYEVLLREQSHEDMERGRELLGERMRALLERGQRSGALRDDVALELLGEMFGGLVVAGLRRALEEGLGIEEASATVVSIFLDGTAGTATRSRPAGAARPLS